MNKTHEHQCVFVPRHDGWEYCECGEKVQVYNPSIGEHLNKITKESAKFMVLVESGFTPTDLQVKYLKLLTFVKNCADDSYYELSAYETFDTLYKLKSDAGELLKEIGEL